LLGNLYAGDGKDKNQREKLGLMKNYWSSLNETKFNNGKN